MINLVSLKLCLMLENLFLMASLRYIFSNVFLEYGRRVKNPLDLLQGPTIEGLPVHCLSMILPGTKSVLALV